MNKYQLMKQGYGKPCCYCRRRVIKDGTDEAYDDPGLVLSIEHKQYPKSKGGNNHTENLDIACKRCNNLRGNIAIELFEPFSRVVIQQYPDIPMPILREALRNYIYHLAELSIKNNAGIKNATLATLIDMDRQVKTRDLKPYRQRIDVDAFDS